MRYMAELSLGWFGHPFSPLSYSPFARRLAASSDLFLRVTQRYEKPEKTLNVPLNFVEKFVPKPLDGPVTAPPPTDHLEYGKYVATKGNTVNRREAPAGSYKLRITVTKAVERGDTSVMTETWLSPTLHIVRAPVPTTTP